VNFGPYRSRQADQTLRLRTKVTSGEQYAKKECTLK
jgi:hypothetical protein